MLKPSKAIRLTETSTTKKPSPKYYVRIWPKVQNKNAQAVSSLSDRVYVTKDSLLDAVAKISLANEFQRTRPFGTATNGNDERTFVDEFSS